MKMSGGVMSCCVALLLALTSVSAVHKKLKSIDDLKKIDFGSSVPKHSLLLLHWFANIVEIDSNNVIWLTFDLSLEDYGSHHYGNYEELLNPLPRGSQYYTVGNLYEDTSEQLPFYVLNPPSEYVGENRDRIIIRVQEQNTERGALQRVEQVYITQHYDTSEHQGTPYDPGHTYQITTSLLRRIREFSVQEQQRPLLSLRNLYGRSIDDFQFNDIRGTWGNLACLGLLLFIVIGEKYSSNQRNNRPENNNRPEDNIRWENNNSPEDDIRLEITYTSEGRWGNNNRSENTEGLCSCRVICCISVFILVLILIIVGIFIFLKQ